MHRGIHATYAVPFSSKAKEPLQLISSKLHLTNENLENQNSQAPPLKSLVAVILPIYYIILKLVITFTDKNVLFIENLGFFQGTKDTRQRI